MYTKLPASLEVKNGTSKTHTLKLLKNLYGGQQEGKVRADLLVEKIIRCSFTISLIDESVWYKDYVVFLCHVDDGIFVLLKNSDFTKEIELLEETTYR